MSVSTISQLAVETVALSTASFVRAGVPYIAWSSPSGDSTAKKLQWKQYNQTSEFTDITAKLVASYNNLCCLLLPSDELLAVWDDSGVAADGSILQAKFNPTTGALISGPTEIAVGAKPSVSFRAGISGQDLVLTYLVRATSYIYSCQSLDSGATWSGARPILGNKVVGTSEIISVPYDNDYMLVGQVGASSRILQEVHMLTRTRPLSCITKHPTLANRFFVGESAVFIDTGGQLRLSDNLRGSIKVTKDNTKILWIDGGRQGTDDGIGNVALLDTSNGISVAAHQTNATGNGSAGDNLVDMPIDLSDAGVATDLYVFGVANNNIDMDISNEYAYVAAYQEFATGVSSVTGAFDVYRISDRARASVVPVTANVLYRCVGVGIPQSGTPLIFAGVTDRGVEKLKIYQENGLTPTLLHVHKLPVRPTGIKAVMDSATSGTLYVSSATGLNTYKFDFSNPLSSAYGHEVDSGTLALWRFNESTGLTAADQTGSSPLTLSGATFGTGYINNGLVCDTINQFASGTSTAGQRTALLSNVSMEAWIYLNSLAVPAAIVGHSSGGETSDTNYLASIRIETTGRIRVFWELNAGVNVIFTTSAGPTISTGQWYHVAFTRATTSSSIVRVYINGEFVQESGTLNNPNGGTSGFWAVGRDGGLTGADVDGIIDDVRVSNVVRTDEEIRESYLRGQPAPPIRLVDSFKLLDGGEILQVEIAENGNIVCAAGRAGVIVFTPKGRQLAQINLSDFYVQEWKPNTVYAVSAKVKARSIHPFSARRLYFNCTTGGTSGTNEPAWSSNTASNSIVDGGTTRWQAVNTYDSFVTGVSIDQSTKTIYAVGLKGGANSTNGAVWAIKATSVL